MQQYKILNLLSKRFLTKYQQLEVNQVILYQQRIPTPSMKMETVYSKLKLANPKVVILSLIPESLSTIVLNSRDWYEIIWLPEISRFKNQPCNRFYPKKPA